MFVLLDKQTILDVQCVGEYDLWSYQVHLLISSDPTAVDINPRAKENWPSTALRNFISVEQQPKSGLGRLILEVHRIHTHTHTHTHDRAPLNKWSARRRGRYLHSTHQTHAFSRIRTRDPSNREVAYICLRPHGRRYRPTKVLPYQNCMFSTKSTEKHYIALVSLGTAAIKPILLYRGIILSEQYLLPLPVC